MRSTEPIGTRLGRVCRAFLLTGLAACLGAAPARAQDARGSISGRVIDTSGAVLPGVSVTIVNTETNTPSTTTTSDQGRYAVLYLLPGTYKVTAVLDGFRTAVNDNIHVRVGDKVQYDVTLEAGGVTEEVRVVADRPVLETGSATMGQVIDSKLISRDPARRRHRLRPEPPRRRRLLRAVLRAAAADGQRQPARPRRQRHDQQRVHDRRLEQRGLAVRASASSRRRTPSRNSRSKPPPTTRRSDTPAPAR